MAATKDEKEAIRATDDSSSSDRNGVESLERGEIVNASGHVQQLYRNFNLLTLAGVGIVVGNVWPALGGSILVAIFNGGPPGTILPMFFDMTSLTEARCHIRIHRSFHILLDHRSQYCGACKCDSQQRWRVPLGVGHAR